jgi:transposase InsO family protein
MFDEERGVDRSGRRSKRFLTPLGKYEIWLQLVRQEMTIGEAADRYQVDRSTIMRIRTVAKDGALAAFAASRPGVKARERDVELEQTKAEVARLSEALDEVIGARQDGRVDPATEDPSRPVLLAVSDNGPQMTSGSTREFMALCAIAQHFGRPGTPTDQAWVETLFGHLKAEWPHLLAIRDPHVLRTELEIIRQRYNGVRLHAGIGYVCPNDEHEGRGEAIRKAREAGLEQSRLRRLTWHRQHRHQQDPGPGDVG